MIIFFISLVALGFMFVLRSLHICSTRVRYTFMFKPSGLFVAGGIGGWLLLQTKYRGVPSRENVVKESYIMRLRDFWICSSKQSPANSFRLCLRAGCWHLKLRTKSRPVRYPSHPHSSLFAFRSSASSGRENPSGFYPFPCIYSYVLLSNVSPH
ncbi:hypothetical protein BKA82DRAFT_4237383 [Pisolithus tinctorius]|nr:hypothetical protein BKA82DRAFT_4237383 [Pisolithus tinctorius]